MNAPAGDFGNGSSDEIGRQITGRPGPVGPFGLCDDGDDVKLVVAPRQIVAFLAKDRSVGVLTP